MIGQLRLWVSGLSPVLRVDAYGASMAGFKRAVGYVSFTVLLTFLALVVGVRVAESAEPSSGSDGLAGLGGVLAAVTTLGLCVLGVIAIECIGAAKRIRAHSGAGQMESGADNMNPLAITAGCLLVAAGVVVALLVLGYTLCESGTCG
jgi:hypothetical protein